MKNLDEEYKEYHSGFSSIVKMIIVTVIFTIMLLQSCLYTFATNYYFSLTGSDANSGTSSASPYQTLTKLNSIQSSLAAGDSVLFKRGDSFYGSIIINKNGSAGNPIVYASYGTGTRPIITGGILVSSWTNLGGNIWESTGAVSTLSSCNMVIINGVNYPMGRTPNTGWYTYSSSTTSSLTSSSLNAATTDWTGAELVSRRTHWRLNRYTITSASGTTVNYTSSGNQTSYAGTANYGFFIQNDVRTLDTANEWYYNPSTKKLRIYSTSMPSNVYPASIDTLVAVQGDANITFANLEFAVSNKDAFVINCQNLTITNCTFDYSGKDAIWGGSNAATSTGTVIQNCTINHTNNNAIYLESLHTNAVIQYDTVKNTGMQAGMGEAGISNASHYTAIIADADNITVNNCYVDTVGFNGIMYYRNGTLVQNNYVHSFNNIIDDGGGIYSWIGQGNTQYSGEKVLNNIVLDGVGNNSGTTNTTQAPSSFGIYLDDYVKGVTVSGNTVSRCSYSGLYIHNAQNDTINNNTFFDNNLQMYFVTGRTDVLNFSIKNNKFISKAATQYVYNFDINSSEYANVGTVDSNYIARPIDDNLTIELDSSNVTIFKTLATWRTYSGFDAHSSKSAKTISTTNDIRLDYNATSSLVNAGIGWYGETVDGLFYNGIVPLAGFASAVTMNDGAVIPNTPITNVKIYQRFKN